MYLMMNWFRNKTDEERLRIQDIFLKSYTEELEWRLDKAERRLKTLDDICYNNSRFIREISNRINKEDNLETTKAEHERN